jgi:uncharacterized membrane protein required for colicin V production
MPEALTRLPNHPVFVIFVRMFELSSCVAQLMVEAEDSSLGVSWVDAISIVFFGYGFISAHRLGLYGELPRAAGWLAALIVGLRGFPYVASQFEEVAHANPDNSAFYGFLLIGIFFLSVGYVIGMTITRLRKKTVQGGLDLWGGFILGPLKMVAAFVWVMVALILLPSVWTRNHLGLNSLTGSMILRMCPDVGSRVETSRGEKDSVDEFIERKKRKAPEEEIDQMESPANTDDGTTESGNP